MFLSELLTYLLLNSPLHLLVQLPSQFHLSPVLPITRASIFKYTAISFFTQNLHKNQSYSFEISGFSNDAEHGRTFAPSTDDVRSIELLDLLPSKESFLLLPLQTSAHNYYTCYCSWTVITMGAMQTFSKCRTLRQLVRLCLPSFTLPRIYPFKENHLILYLFVLMVDQYI